MRVKERSIDVLWNVYQLLSDPARWCSMLLAVDEKGVPVNPTDPSAVKWSITGALTRYETSVLAINALHSVSGRDLKTLELSATHSELLRFLSDGILWLENWHEYH